MPDLLFLLPILVFLCLEGLFSGGEIALVACDINIVRQKAEAGSRSASIALRLLEKAGVVSVHDTDRHKSLLRQQHRHHHRHVHIHVRTRTGRAALHSGHDTPYPDRGRGHTQKHLPAARGCYGPQDFLVYMDRLVDFLSGCLCPVKNFTKGDLRVLKKKDLAYSSYITKNGLESLLQEEKSGGDIMKSEKEMIQKIFDFSDSTADQIMVPLSNVTLLPAKTTLREAARVIAERGYSHIPVYSEKVFNIIGILYSFDVLESIHEKDRGLPRRMNPSLKTA